MEIKGLKVYSESKEGSLDLPLLFDFLSQHNLSRTSGRIYFSIKERTKPDGKTVESCFIKKHNLARLQ